MTERDAVRSLVTFVQVAPENAANDEVKEAIRVVLHHIKVREVETKTIEEILIRISEKLDAAMPPARPQSLGF